MIVFTVTVLDEFGRLYGNASAHAPIEFEVGPDWVYQYWMRHLVTPILERMGTDAHASWTCRMEDWSVPDD